MTGLPTISTLFRWIGQALTLLVVIAVIASIFIYCNRPGQVPDIESYPWAIQTYSNKLPSRIYIAKEVEYAQDGTLTITNYYSFDGTNWRKERGDKVFPTFGYGKIDIRRRS